MSTVREIADAARRVRRPAPRVPTESRRRLRIMQLADGRTNLIEPDGTVFMPCASPEVAARMRAVFSR